MDTETKTYKLSELYPDVAAKAAQRLHVKKDEIPFVRKYFVADKESVQVDAQTRSVVARISCVNTDRDGESLLPEGVLLENYKRNPIVCWGHSYNSPEQIIGKNLWIKADDKGLIAKTAFANNEFADQVYRAYTEDVGGTGPLLRGWSVGFIPIEYETPTKQANGAPRRIYTKWELLEYSAVPIPCSPESLTLAYEKGIITSASLKKDFDPAPIPGDLGPDDQPTFSSVTLPITDTAVQPKIDFCEACGTGMGAEDATAGDLIPKEVPVSEAVIKMFDTEQNPSVSDIYDALYRALNPPAMQEKPGSIMVYKDIWDLYPVDFPSGHCVYRQTVGDAAPEFFLCNYIYEKGTVTIDEIAVPVVPAYAKRRGKGKGMESKEVGSVSIKIGADISEFTANVDALQAKLDLMLKTADEIEAKVAKESPAPPIVPAPAIPAVPPVDAEDILAMLDEEVPPAPPDDINLDEFLKSPDYKRTIGEAIEIALAKLRGRVI